MNDPAPSSAPSSALVPPPSPPIRDPRPSPASPPCSGWWWGRRSRSGGPWRRCSRGPPAAGGPSGRGQDHPRERPRPHPGGSFQRVQGTNDLLPSDLLGVHLWDAQAQAFRFQPGPVFCNVLLMDELNRIGPKTQSALLEVMVEGQVTLDRQTLPLPDPFFVLATQNPWITRGPSPSRKPIGSLRLRDPPRLSRARRRAESPEG